MSRSNPIIEHSLIGRLRKRRGFEGKGRLVRAVTAGKTAPELLSARLVDKYRFFIARILLPQQQDFWTRCRLFFEFALPYWVIEREATWHGEQTYGAILQNPTYQIGSNVASATNIFVKDILSRGNEHFIHSYTRFVVNKESVLSSVTKGLSASAAVIYTNHVATHAIGFSERAAGNSDVVPASSGQALPGRQAIFSPTQADIQAHVPVALLWSKEQSISSYLQQAETRFHSAAPLWGPVAIEKNKAEIAIHHKPAPADSAQTKNNLLHAERFVDSRRRLAALILPHRVVADAGALENDDRPPSPSQSFNDKWSMESVANLTHRWAPLAPASGSQSALAALRLSHSHAPSSHPSEGSPDARHPEFAPVRLSRAVGIAEPRSAHGNSLPDVNKMAEDVYALLEKKLRIERERRGIFA